MAYFIPVFERVFPVWFALMLVVTVSAADDGFRLPLWGRSSAKPIPLESADGGTDAATLHKTSQSSTWGMSNAWSKMATGTKRCWNTTFDVVTLKPLRRGFASKPEPELELGLKPDPRRKKTEPSSGIASWFRPRQPQQPKTIEEFFNQERP